MINPWIENWRRGYRLATLDMGSPERGAKYSYMLFYKYSDLYLDLGDEDDRECVSLGYAQGLRACGFGDRSIF